MAENKASGSPDKAKRKYLLRRFWHSALGFWGRDAGGHARLLTVGLALIVILQVIVQFRINVWNRSIFDALEQKKAAEVLWQALILAPLAPAGILRAARPVYD